MWEREPETTYVPMPAGPVSQPALVPEDTLCAVGKLTLIVVILIVRRPVQHAEDFEDVTVAVVAVELVTCTVEAEHQFARSPITFRRRGRKGASRGAEALVHGILIFLAFGTSRGVGGKKVPIHGVSQYGIRTDSVSLVVIHEQASSVLLETKKKGQVNKPTPNMELLAGSGAYKGHELSAALSMNTSTCRPAAA